MSFSITVVMFTMHFSLSSCRDEKLLELILSRVDSNTVQPCRKPAFDTFCASKRPENYVEISLLVMVADIDECYGYTSLSSPPPQIHTPKASQSPVATIRSVSCNNGKMHFSEVYEYVCRIFLTIDNKWFPKPWQLVALSNSDCFLRGTAWSFIFRESERVWHALDNKDNNMSRELRGEGGNHKFKTSAEDVTMSYNITNCSRKCVIPVVCVKLGKWYVVKQLCHIRCI